MTTTHVPEHEEDLLRYAVAGEGDHAALATRLVACDECLSYAVAVIDDLTALRARGRMDPATRPASVARLDELLDDVMILLGPPEPPAGGEAGGSAAAGDKRAVPVGGKRK